MKKINKGDLLVSMPEILDDAIFNRTVIFITEISNDSVTGFIVNKCHQFNLTDIDKRISEHKIKIYDGTTKFSKLYYMYYQVVQYLIVLRIVLVLASTSIRIHVYMMYYMYRP